MNNSHFIANIIQGAGRGRKIGAPTINIRLEDIPSSIEEGIYAGWINIDETWCPAAIHYGPRPVFKDSRAFEVHVLDRTIDTPPSSATIALVQRLRDVQDFPSTEALMAQIHDDIGQTRDILEEHDPPPSETADS